MGLRVGRAPHVHGGEWKAALGERDRKIVDGLLHQRGVVGVAVPRLERDGERMAVDLRDVRVDIDLAEAVGRALVDRIGHHDALERRLELGAHRRDAHIDIAAVEIEGAQQVAIDVPHSTHRVYQDREEC